MAAPSGIITLLTDFGLSDPFVGIMKGVILSAFPTARVIDLCHGIPPQSVAEAAFWLERSHAWFPPGSVHVAVVDPGVGSPRAIVALAAAGHYFLAPDNGLLAPSLLASPGAVARAVDLDRLELRPHSATFHGRDIFAPLAARLASGALPLAALGEPIEPLPCVLTAPSSDGACIRGAVVTVDRFGNLITNLGRDLVESNRARHVLLGDRAIPLVRAYADARPGELLAVINAFDVIEIAVRDGNAEERLGLGRQTSVHLPIAGQVLRT
jgi:S-adenosyl-L-methionine hydrolase (adenosine-forming)